MRLLVLFGIVGCVACTRTNPSYGDGGSSGKIDDDGTGDDSLTGASASVSASVGDDAITDSGDGSVTHAESTDPTLDGTGTVGGHCCEAHPEPGCREPDVEACVCAEEAKCCELGWIELCAQKASSCGDSCGLLDTGLFDEGSSAGTSGSSTDEGGTTTTSDGGSSTTDGAVPNACCVASEFPSCDDKAIATCVCGVNKTMYCCESAWDPFCVAAAEACGLRCDL